MESDGGGLIGGIVGLVLGILTLVAMWKFFAKAGRPGWGVLIPFYNIYLMLKIAGKPGWWMIFYFIPLVNIVVSFVVAVAIAKAFNKGVLFGIFLLGLFSFIGYLILGFGGATYSGISEIPTQPKQEPEMPTPPLIEQKKV